MPTDISAYASDYKLVYADEFDGTALNSNVWGDYTANPVKRWSVFQLPEVTSSTGSLYGKNQEEYGKVEPPDSKGVTVENGCAYITAECSDTTNYKTATYTNRQPTTQNRLNYRYGLWEIRAKLPKYPAVAALWSTGTGLEIDLAEGGQNSDGSYDFYANVHIKNPNGTGNRVAHSYSRYSNRKFTTEFDLSEDFHTYSVLWTPDVLKFYVDGKAFWTLDLHEFDVLDSLSGVTQYMLLGISYCSTADTIPYFCSANDINNYVSSGKTLPAKTSLVVDYVRLYQSTKYNPADGNVATNTKGYNYFKIN